MIDQQSFVSALLADTLRTVLASPSGSVVSVVSPTPTSCALVSEAVVAAFARHRPNFLAVSAVGGPTGVLRAVARELDAEDPPPADALPLSVSLARRTDDQLVAALVPHMRNRLAARGSGDIVVSAAPDLVVNRRQTGLLAALAREASVCVVVVCARTSAPKAMQIHVPRWERTRVEAALAAEVTAGRVSSGEAHTVVAKAYPGGRRLADPAVVVARVVAASFDGKP